uniref:Lipoprotein n=1 Tax=Pseudomonas fluorescens (strain SBW25) TaxID=216595 RepID=A0A0G4E5K7_PSEFS|nr:hypothetical protein [Pseudomonas fluorescens]CEK42308.1 hypothetical protein PQBR57_0355 [Pseudomonas fluorescens SBW25]
MTCSKFLMIAALTVAGTLAGCSGITPVRQAPVASASQPVLTVPVYIVPNCQMLAGKQNCYWMEPRGYKPTEPTKTSTKQVDGIAL